MKKSVLVVVCLVLSFLTACSPTREKTADSVDIEEKVDNCGKGETEITYLKLNELILDFVKLTKEKWNEFFDYKNEGVLEFTKKGNSEQHIYI